MNRKLMNYLAALLLVLCAVWNIKCESDKKEVRERQAAFLQYIHINSKPYKQSLKMDTLFAQRLDISPLSEGTIKLLQSSKLLQRRNDGERTVRNDKVNKTVSKKPQNLYKKKK